MALVLRSAAFRAEREASWRELERLVAKARRGGVRRLSAEELAHLPGLYRAALSSLSVARAISLDRNLVEYLESLSARAYLLVYSTRRNLADAVAGFLGARFPALVRTLRWHVLLAAACLAAGAVTGFALVLRDPERFFELVGPALAQGRDPDASTAALRDALYTPRSAAQMLTTFAMFLFSNNAKVGMLAFAVGFAGGLPAAVLVFTNGLTLGAFAALYHGRGLSVELWAWLLPHGVTELLAVVLCGAAGLAVGQALVFPGRSERLAGLAARGREAGAVVMGAVVLFFAAALLEGVFRQLVHAVPVRYAVAGASALLWATYFVRAGRGRAEGGGP